MEWLAWSTSQELRTESVLYRMMRTAVRSALMHSAIFSFFAGLLVLLWEVTPPSVFIMPTIITISFSVTIWSVQTQVYYAAATLRPVYLTGWKGIGQFDEVDARGLRVQVWTPFSVGTQRLANYIGAIVLLPLRRSFQRLRRYLGHQEPTHTRDLEAQAEGPPLTMAQS
ncbi:hypothetical protein FRC04_010682 [Tulasnella sp. 424]|nr:hypothetical protein FRC04_010682 [Tulasnella sp. 424]